MCLCTQVDGICICESVWACIRRDKRTSRSMPVFVGLGPSPCGDLQVCLYLCVLGCLCHCVSLQVFVPAGVSVPVSVHLSG